jgi:hypothetical protein
MCFRPSSAPQQNWRCMTVPVRAPCRPATLPARCTKSDTSTARVSLPPQCLARPRHHTQHPDGQGYAHAYCLELKTAAIGCFAAKTSCQQKRGKVQLAPEA